MEVHQQPITQENLLRKRIRDIQNDPLTNPREKARMVQSLMTRTATCIQAQPKSHNLSPTCSHYDKKCSQLYFECCEIYDPCHRCHMARGECNVRPAHVTSVMCNSCQHRQAPAQDCENCGERMGKSFCGICKIWTPAEIFHCNDCGICRVGKPEDVFHCHNCEACFGIEGREQHRCAKVQLKGACCPMCLESVHSAQKPSSILRCGHVIHADCWKESARKGEFRCPTCRKSLFEMQDFWNNIRRSIEMQPIPKNFFPIRVGDVVDSPYGPFQILNRREISQGGSVQSPDSQCGEAKVQWEGIFPEWQLAHGQSARATLEESLLDTRKKVKIFCFDCEAKTTTLFHFLGLECQCCKGFNTRDRKSVV